MDSEAVVQVIEALSASSTKRISNDIYIHIYEVYGTMSIKISYINTYYILHNGNSQSQVVYDKGYTMCIR